MTAQEHYDGQYGRWMEMREMRDGFEFGAIPVSYTHLDVYKRQPSIDKKISQ